ncbi:MAG: rodZ [Gammaproteobacteria bacterium]|jgi:cytoskeleton protein RodZ|nr:rodZ [Gammaproteobacteria bacterium]
MDSTNTIPENSKNSMNKFEFFKKTGLGERLRLAREAMHFTEKEVATRLHLNTKIIFLIESENFSEGPPSAFIKGYIRSYAKLLNLPQNEIALSLKELESIIPSSNATIAIAPIQPRKQNERYFHWLTYLIILILSILVSMWWSSHPRYVTAEAPAIQPSIPSSPPATALQNITSQQQLNQLKTDPKQVAASNNNSVLQSTTMLKAVDSSKKTYEPPVSTTPLMVSNIPSSTAPVTTTKPQKNSEVSHLGMALPEPGIDTHQNENNND